MVFMSYCLLSSMERLIIFVDFTSPFIPMLLTKATLQAVSKRSDVEIVGICVNNLQKYHQLLFRYFQTIIKSKIRYLFDPREKQSSSFTVDRLAFAIKQEQ